MTQKQITSARYATQHNTFLPRKQRDCKRNRHHTHTHSTAILYALVSMPYTTPHIPMHRTAFDVHHGIQMRSNRMSLQPHPPQVSHKLFARHRSNKALRRHVIVYLCGWGHDPTVISVLVTHVFRTRGTHMARMEWPIFGGARQSFSAHMSMRIGPMFTLADIVMGFSCAFLFLTNNFQRNTWPD